MKSRLKIIVPHYDRHDRLVELLGSMPHAMGQQTEVHVVCGGTFAQNCNRAAAAELFMNQLPTRYLFLNDDCYFGSHQELGELLTQVTNAPTPIVGCAMKSPPDHKPENPLVQGVLIRVVDGQLEMALTEGIPEPGPAQIAFPSGACFAVDAALFHELGGFDEEFRNGWEDVDFFLRALEKGVQIGFVTEPAVFHWQAESHGRYASINANRDRFHDLWTKERLLKFIPLEESPPPEKPKPKRRTRKRTASAKAK